MAPPEVNLTYQTSPHRKHLLISLYAIETFAPPILTRIIITSPTFSDQIRETAFTPNPEHHSYSSSTRRRTSANQHPCAPSCTATTATTTSTSFEWVAVRFDATLLSRQT